MRSAVLLDTNILIYAANADSDRRHRLALDLLRRLRAGEIVITTQTLSEFANVMTHPSKFAHDAAVVGVAVRKLDTEHTVLHVTPETVVRALEARERWGLSYYDAQIWASAALAGVPVVLSEDFTDGLVLGPVRFVDPFAQGFDLDALRAELDG